MSKYILDTDTCVYWLNGNENIRGKAAQAGPENLNTTIITYAELRYGAYNSGRAEENMRNIDNFFRKVGVILLNRNASDRFGKIKAELRKRGQMIGDFDILIASVALIHDAVLVTNNTAHFGRIPDLCYENWMNPDAVV